MDLERLPVHCVDQRQAGLCLCCRPNEFRYRGTALSASDQRNAWTPFLNLVYPHVYTIRGYVKGIELWTSVYKPTTILYVRDEKNVVNLHNSWRFHFQHFQHRPIKLPLLKSTTTWEISLSMDQLWEYRQCTFFLQLYLAIIDICWLF